MVSQIHFSSPTFIGVNFKYKMLDFSSKKVKIQLWDTAGTDHSNPLLKIYYKKAMGIVLVFSLEDSQSFHNIHTWMHYLQTHLHPNAIVILVGNKCDLSKRAVDAKEIKNLQQKYNIERYIETSAKDASNVNETFTELVQEVKNRIDNGMFKAEESPSSKSSSQ